MFLSKKDMSKKLDIENSVLTENASKTYIMSDLTSGTSVTVQSVSGFSTGKVVLVGEIGQEEAEILQTHNISSPSGTSLYLQNAPTYDHSVDTPIYLVDWNQIEITHAATASGVKSILSYGWTLTPDRQFTTYKDTSKTSGFYFIRFVDTVGSAYSDYSDPIPYAGYPDNTVWAIKDRALKKVDAKIDSNITHEFLNDCLWSARREYHQAPGKRPFRRVFDFDLGNVSNGAYRITAPNDLEKPTSGENIFGVRIGQNNVVNFYDKKKLDDDYRNVAHTVLSSAYSTGDAYVIVANARDFSNSGSVNLESDTVEYSAKELSTGSLTVSVDGIADHTANTDIWQNKSYGLPVNYTAFKNPSESAYIYFNCPFDTVYVGQNIWCDYYRTLVPFDSDADELDEPWADMYVDYLAYRIKKRLDPKLDEHKDSDFLEWQRKKQQALNDEYLGSEIRFVPDI